MLREELFSFENHGTQIAAILHRPTKAIRARGGLVFCPPFAEEAWHGHRELVVFARLLARAGVAVLRFDYRGTGDSEGDFAEFSLADRQSDIRRAIAVLEDRADVGHVGALGLRLGATLAGRAAADGSVACLIQWAPLTAKGFLRQLRYWYALRQVFQRRSMSNGKDALFARFESGESVDLAGHLLTPTLYEEARNLDAYTIAAGHPADVLLVGFERDRSQSAEIESIAQRYASAEVVWVPEPMFWLTIGYDSPVTLYERTAAWIDRVLDGRGGER